MAHNRAERRYKTVLIKHKLERIVQREVADEMQRTWYSGRNDYRPFIPIRGGKEDAIRRRRFSNEGRHGRICLDCGAHACDWCLRNFYRKHLQRAQALENDLLEYVRGDYDVLCEEGETIPSAMLTRLPPIMKEAVPK